MGGLKSLPTAVSAYHHKDHEGRAQNLDGSPPFGAPNVDITHPEVSSMFSPLTSKL